MFFATEGVRKSFDGLVAVNDVTTSFSKGVITAIIGPNGAGKTTFVNLCTGVFRPDRGKVLLSGMNVTALAPNEKVARGIGRTFQITNIFQGLKVRENVRIPLLSRVRGVSLTEETERLLRLFNLEGEAENPASSMSHGDQKLLEVAMCLALNPEIIFLDEPMAGVNPGDRGRIIEIIFDLKERGLAVVLIEHNMDAVFTVADRILVMHRGELIAEGLPEEIKNNEEVVEIYLGGLE